MLTVKLLPICVKNSKQLVFNDRLIMTYSTCILLNYFIKSGPQGDFLTQRHIRYLNSANSIKVQILSKARLWEKQRGKLKDFISQILFRLPIYIILD